MDRFGKVEYGNDDYSIENAKKSELEDRFPKGKILFVCTSNRFVSPVAEAIFNEKTGGEAMSAGLVVPFFTEPEFATIRICQNHGIDISDWRITDIGDVEMDEVGLVLTATCEIRDYLKPWYPNLEIFTIREYSGYSTLDIEDPLGGGYDDFERCFNEIHEAVSRIADGKPNITSPTKIRTFKHLDEAIHSGSKEIALEGDIVLSEEEESEYSKGIRLDVDDLTIDGNGFTIDAKHKARIFECNAKNVTVKNITFQNGYLETVFGPSYDGGAAILNTRELTIAGSAFKDNESNYGGAVYNAFGKLDILDSEISGNTAHDDGGAVYNKNGKVKILRSVICNNDSRTMGGAICNINGKLEILESEINNNSLADGLGGAIYNDELGFLIICDSSLSGNMTGKGFNRSPSEFLRRDLKEFEMNGGAIYNDGEMTIKNSKLSNNSSQNRGGAIYNDFGKLNVIDSEISMNMAEENGGAIFNDWGILNITNTLLYHNIVKNEGGAIFNGSELNINESRMTHNKAGCSGAISNKFELVITDCEIKSNSCKGSGGAILNRGNLNIADSKLSDNSGENGGTILNSGNLDIADCALFGNMAACEGGAISNGMGDVKIARCEVFRNLSKGNGGAIYNFGELDIADSNISRNACEGSGGAIYYEKGEVNIINSALKYNACKGRGGAILFSIANRFAQYDISAINWLGHNGHSSSSHRHCYNIRDCVFENNSPENAYKS